MDRKRLKEAKVLAERIAKLYKPDRIILFGSLSRQEDKKDSDIDLFIVKESKKKRPFRTKEVFEILRGVKREYALDPIVYTPKEIKKRLALGDYFIRNIFLEGKVLYGQR